MLTEEEKNYLYAVIKPFINKVVYICKVELFLEKALIRIALVGETVNLPIFDSCKMYKGLKINKKYKVKELFAEVNK